MMAPTVNAHSGGTDSSGGHHCWTNCEDYGYEYGEYHFHNQEPEVNNTEQVIESTESQDNEYENGYEWGYNEIYTIYSVCEEGYDLSWEGTEEYNNGAKQGMEDAEKEGKEACLNLSYEKGFETGRKDYNSQQSGSSFHTLSSSLPSYARSSAYEGYKDGEEHAKNVFKESLASSDETLNNTEDKISNEDEVYNEGYEDGKESAIGDYLFDDFDFKYNNSAELTIYQKGYLAGWAENGGDFRAEFIMFWLTKYYFALILIGFFTLIIAFWISRKVLRNKKNIDE